MRTLNTTRPMMTPAAKKANAWMSQMTPHTVRRRDQKVLVGTEGLGRDVPWEGQQPQISANDDASEPFTFRAIVSSAGG